MSRETQQITIRLALGEMPADTRRRGRGLLTVGLGIALGAVGSFLLARLTYGSR